MTRCTWLAAVGLVASLGAADLASSQSLGEVARREAAKKKAKPATSAPAFTADDLEAGRAHANGTVTTLEEPAHPLPTGPSPSPEPDRRALEREWRARFAAARARIAAADARAFEDRIEVVFVSGIPVQQRVRVKVETPELVSARQAHADLEEELRRAGMPPGWGRE